jgi:hypothetical protein
MRPEKKPRSGQTGSRPTRQDRVFVLLTSWGLFVVLLLVICLIQGPAIDRVVLLVVIGLPVVIIKVLFPFSRWEIPSSNVLRPAPPVPSMEVSDGSAKEDWQPFLLRERKNSRRRLKTVDGTSFRSIQYDGRYLLNGRPLLKVRFSKDSMVHLQTDEQQFRIDGATYWTMVFGGQRPTPMQAGLLLARLDELTDLLQSSVSEKPDPPGPPCPA